jgi:ribosomal protein L29
LKQLSTKDIEVKMAELRLELIKANVAANKVNAKTKEIKRAIARLKTFISLQEVKK